MIKGGTSRVLGVEARVAVTSKVATSFLTPFRRVGGVIEYIGQSCHGLAGFGRNFLFGRRERTSWSISSEEVATMVRLARPVQSEYSRSDLLFFFSRQLVSDETEGKRILSDLSTPSSTLRW